MKGVGRSVQHFCLIHLSVDGRARACFWGRLVNVKMVWGACGVRACVPACVCVLGGGGGTLQGCKMLASSSVRELKIRVGRLSTSGYLSKFLGSGYPQVFSAFFSPPRTISAAAFLEWLKVRVLG